MRVLFLFTLFSLNSWIMLDYFNIDLYPLQAKAKLSKNDLMSKQLTHCAKLVMEKDYKASFIKKELCKNDQECYSNRKNFHDDFEVEIDKCSLIKEQAMRTKYEELSEKPDKDRNYLEDNKIKWQLITGTYSSGGSFTVTAASSNILAVMVSFQGSDSGPDLYRTFNLNNSTEISYDFDVRYSGTTITVDLISGNVFNGKPYKILVFYQ